MSCPLHLMGILIILGPFKLDKEPSGITLLLPFEPFCISDSTLHSHTMECYLYVTDIFLTHFVWLAWFPKPNYDWWIFTREIPEG